MNQGYSTIASFQPATAFVLFVAYTSMCPTCRMHRYKDVLCVGAIMTVRNCDFV